MRNWRQSFRKYFLQDQNKIGGKSATNNNNKSVVEHCSRASENTNDDNDEKVMGFNGNDDDELLGWFGKNRRLLGFILPALFFHLLWWPIAISQDLFPLFTDTYFMSITMVFGSMIAGMTAAAFTIVWMHIKLEYRSLLFCTIGGVFGLISGLHSLDLVISADQRKMGFVSVFFSFAIALFILNRRKKRPVFDAIPQFRAWKASILLGSGFIGGAMTGLVGSGVDILSFSVLTLLFSVSERVATPTSVVLMAINTSVGFYWRQLIMTGGISQEAWNYLIVCIPVVVLFAPFGSLIASHFHRQVLAGMIYVLETVALVSAFVIIRPSLQLTLASVALIFGATVCFLLLSWCGMKLSLSSRSYGINHGQRSAEKRLRTFVAVENYDETDDPLQPTASKTDESESVTINTVIKNSE